MNKDNSPYVILIAILLLSFVITSLITIYQYGQDRVITSVKEKNTELIEKINRLNGWNDNLSQITVRYMDLMDEFGCGRITFVEERACMQKYKPQ